MDEEKGYEPPAWLLTYGDMVTLLVTFFVMLISLSTINMDKFKKNMWKIQKTDDSENVSLLEDSKTLAENPFENELEAAENPETFKTEEYREEPIDIEDMYYYVYNFINDGELAQYVDIEDIKRGCKIKIPANLCFEKNESTMKKESYATFDKLGIVLRTIRGKISINTHINNITKLNGELKKANNLKIDRAVRICDFLVTTGNIEPQRIALLGNRIVNNDEENIEIIIMK